MSVSAVGRGVSERFQVWVLVFKGTWSQREVVKVVVTVNGMYRVVSRVCKGIGGTMVAV